MRALSASPTTPAACHSTGVKEGWQSDGGGIDILTAVSREAVQKQSTMQKQSVSINGRTVSPGDCVISSA